jgi:hypothetical protein
MNSIFNNFVLIANINTNATNGLSTSGSVNNNNNNNNGVNECSVEKSNGYDSQAFSDRISNIRTKDTPMAKFIRNSKGKYSYNMVKNFFNNKNVVTSVGNDYEKFMCAIKRFFAMALDDSLNNGCGECKFASSQNRQLRFCTEEHDYNPNNSHTNILGSNVNYDLYIKSVLPTLDGKTMKITDPSNIKSRINYAVSGNTNIDLLENTGAIVTGGIMSATNVLINPLSLQFMQDSNQNNNSTNSTSCTDSEELYKQFLDKYYKTSDIDVIMSELQDLDFIKVFVVFLTTVNKNIVGKMKVKNSEIRVDINKTGYFDYNEEFKTNNPDFFDDNGLPIKQKFYDMYVKEFDKNSKNNTEDNVMLNYKPTGISDALLNKLKTKKVDIEAFYVRYDEFIRPIKSTLFNKLIGMYFNDEKSYQIKTINKFKISSPHLRRSIEVFNAKQGIAKCIKNFHLSCVRSHFDTKTNILHIDCPSALTAYTTMINTQFRYHNTVRDKTFITIASKYLSRGYGIVVNDSDEKSVLLEKLELDNKDFIPYGNKLFSIDENIAKDLDESLPKYDTMTERDDLDDMDNKKYTDDEYKSYWCNPSKLQ